MSWDNRECQGPDFHHTTRHFQLKSSHTFRADAAAFDETNLVSSAGLIPVLELAEHAGLSELIDTHVDIDSARVKSGAANPVGS